MNYYPHHIGDFRSGTINMTRLERWIYRDMLDIYYDTEKPLPLDQEKVRDLVGARTDEECKIVAYLLRFKFRKSDDGYSHERCDTEIKAYHQKAETARTNGKAGGRPKGSRAKEQPSGNLPGFEIEPDGMQSPTGSKTNQEPVTNNQDKSNPVTQLTLSEENGRPATPVELSIALRKQGVNCQAADPRLLALSGQGVTVGTVDAACAEAKISKFDQRVIPLGYVVGIIERWAAEARAISVSGAVVPRAPPRGYESEKDRSRRTTLEGLTGHRSNEQPPEFIDIDPLA